MKYDIELVNCNGHQLQVIKKLREISGCDLTAARRCVDSVPCIAFENMDEEMTESIKEQLEAIGAEIKLISKGIEGAQIMSVSECSAPTESELIYESGNNDRGTLVKLWSDYHKRNEFIRNADMKISENQQKIIQFEKNIKEIKKNIDDNKRIKATDGDCLRPKADRYPLLDFSVFDIDDIKEIYLPIAGVLAAIYFIVMLILVAVTPKTVENIAITINAPGGAGAMIWGGAIAVGLVGLLVILLICIIREAIDTHKLNKANAWKYKNFDTSKPLREANAFLDKIEEHNAEINKNQVEITVLNEQINEIEKQKKELPAVKNNIPMPNELRCTEGVALLIQYIDTGRAITLQEAINLYYQDVKDSRRMAELQKQTRYAQEQMLNSRVAAENSRIAAENSKRMYEAAERAARASERAADAAEEAATYEKLSFYDNLAKK